MPQSRSEDCVRYVVSAKMFSGRRASTVAHANSRVVNPAYAMLRVPSRVNATTESLSFPVANVGRTALSTAAGTPPRHTARIRLATPEFAGYRSFHRTVLPAARRHWQILARARPAPNAASTVLVSTMMRIRAIRATRTLQAMRIRIPRVRIRTPMPPTQQAVIVRHKF